MARSAKLYLDGGGENIDTIVFNTRSICL